MPLSPGHVFAANPLRYPWVAQGLTPRDGRRYPHYTSNWTVEIFVVDKVQNTNPVTHHIKDLNGEEIKESFYEPELQLTNQTIFRIDKVLRRDYKKKSALVKWKGYNELFNTWVSLREFENIT